MSGTPGTKPPGAGTSLFEHALRLHGATPDAALPRNGEPYPDDAYRRGRPAAEHPCHRDRIGAEVAAVLDEHFADPGTDPGVLFGRFQDIHVPIHPNPRMAGAAARGGDRAREAGRRLVVHGTDRDDVAVGLALLAEVCTEDDIPLLRTIGLLSCSFGALAAHALERLPGGAGPLLWLADRVAGWGRVYVVESLCRLADAHPDVRPWLLRTAVDGDFLNGCFAGTVAETVDLRRALAGTAADPGIVDHAGELLHVLTGCQGMGITLADLPHAEDVLAAYLGHLGRLGPSPRRYRAVAHLALGLGEGGDVGSIGPARRWWTFRDGCRALLDREEWCATAREALAAGDEDMARLAERSAGDLCSRAFGDARPSPRHG
ncbi:hypothetical protein [Streptomyces fructofermentans]|uniref:Uncharacterized protein n=1 Tax=Streptomyces fructofermentans TaxID=152141 RepID=A0A918KP46_9ACTN|nr:hypothetical protein [Streptomyces fructofermentans]GGX71135.1 hypothetical protein GCM10010515_43330 [Streptomyces fructofermentans]